MDFSGASSIFHEDLRLNGNDHEPIKNARLAESISSIMTQVEMAKNIKLFCQLIWKTFLHLDRANSIETALRTCNL